MSAEAMAMIASGGSFLKDIAALAPIFSGGLKSQTSNRDYQHQQNLLDSGNPREIKRQSAFLEGLAPSQGAAYNTIQDATYAQDTQRQTDRIQTMGSELGMSPWEITGSPGSSPLPSPTGPAPQNNNAQYLSSLAQMQASVNQNKTSLKIAAMNNDTALKQTQIQADTQRGIADQATGNGQKPLAEIDLTRDQQKAVQAATRLTWTQNEVAENDAALRTIAELAKLAGTYKIQIPGYEASGNNMSRELTALYTLMQNRDTRVNETDWLKNYISKLPKNKFDGLANDAKAVAKIGLEAVGDIGKNIWDMGSSFMSTLTAKQNEKQPQRGQ